MDIEQAFNDLGVDAVNGVKLMNMLGLSSSDFHEPARFMRFKDIIDYFKDVPDPAFVLGRITTGKLVDKLDHVWGYCELARQKSAIKSEADAVNKQIGITSKFEDGNPLAVNELVRKSNDIANRANDIDQQMQAYEN